MASKKFYAVKKGRSVGIFRTWDECKKQVNKYSGAEFKSFATKEEAEKYLGNKKRGKRKGNKKKLVAYVDGSYNERENLGGYGCVLLEGDTIRKKLRGSIVLKKDNSRNIHGELWATIKAVKWAIDNEYGVVEVRYDYMGIENWAKGMWKTNKKLTKNYRRKMVKLMEQIDVEFTKVKAHSGNKYNDIADVLAKEAAGI